MKLYGLSEGMLRVIINRVSNEKYGGNLTWKRMEERGRHIEFTLRVHSSKGPGAKRGFPKLDGSKGKRTVAACWHAHYDVMEEIFNHFPNAKLVSAQARYNNARHFEMYAEATGDRNIGSAYNPLCYADACDCEEREYEAAKNAVPELVPSARDEAGDLQPMN